MLRAKVLAVVVTIGTVIATVVVAADNASTSSDRFAGAVIVLLIGSFYALMLFVAGAVIDVFLGMDEKLSELVDRDDEDETGG